MPRFALSLLSVLTLLSGCVGSMDAQGARQEGADAPPGTLPPGAQDPRADMHGGQDMADRADMSAAPAVAPPMPLRRLSAQELERTIEDVFELDLSQGLSESSRAHGFDNQVADQFVGESLQSDYLSSTDAIAEQLAQRHRGACEDGADATAARACAREVIASYGARLWRRPLAEQDLERILAVHESGFERGGHSEGLHAMFQFVMLSAHFLYRPELTAPSQDITDWELATRLSYFLWRSAPDDALLAAAQAGTLSQPAELEAQVRRMLDDERARYTLGRFLAMLFEVDGLRGAEKQGERWDQEVAAQLIDDFEALGAALILDEGATFEDLLLSQQVRVSPQTAWIYDVQPADRDATGLVMMPQPGAGLLTHPAVMAQFAKFNYASSVTRGYFVRTKILCETVASPGADVIQEEPDVQEDNPLIDPFAYTLETSPCSSCHVSMNPIGTSMAAYDAIGRYVPERQSQRVDTLGSIIGGRAPAQALDGAVALGQHLVESPSVHECFSSQWLTFAWGDSLSPGHQPAIQQLSQITRQGSTLKDFLVALTTSQTFLGR